MKYRLNLKPYEVDFERWEINDKKERELKTGKEPFDVKTEMRELLRAPGVFQGLTEAYDALKLADKIEACQDDSIDLTAEEKEKIKKVFDKFIAREHNPAAGQIALGGPRYNELIRRVVEMEEVSD